MKLCVAVAEPTVDRARVVAERAIALGARAEIRVDALAECDRLEASDLSALGGLGPPEALVLTFRRPRDSGRAAEPDVLPDDRRIALLAAAHARLDAFCDVEDDCAAIAERLGIPASRTILSRHDFDGTPANLVEVFDRMTARPAAVYKLATLARTTADACRHFDVLARARATGRTAIAIAMGEKGIATRVLGPMLGAAFTYCSAERGRELAPGLVPFDEMRSVYRADRATAETLVTGLVAGTVGYSRSPAMHNALAAALGLDLMYVPWAVDDLGAFVPWLRRSGLRLGGFSVTNPFKTAIVEHLDRLEPLAERVGAVNTVVVEPDGTWTGTNTDVEGAMRPLERVAGRLEGLRVGVVGAGGAAQAVLCGLLARGAQATIYARQPERGAAIAERFGVASAGIEAIERAGLDVLVNATPAGTRGVADGVSPVPEGVLPGIRVVYDLVYAPERTPLIEAAERAGCRTLGGLPMLATQAALQFERWTGQPADPDCMLAFGSQPASPSAG